jgi:hypothetical protein
MAINLTTLLTGLMQDLNSASFTDADLIWWTTAELYEFADEAAKWLARECGCFCEVATFAASGAVDLGALHISTIHAAIDGRTLREATVRELEALDAGWNARVATVAVPAKRWAPTGSQTLRIYPAPASGTIEAIEHRLPADITSVAPSLAAPPAIASFLAMSVLGAARGKEGDASMPEIAQHCAGNLKLYARVFANLYGAG